MIFEWDEDKSARNDAERGLPFEDAALAFLDPRRIILRDEREDYGEDRFNLFGLIEGRLFVVTFTMRGEVVRIISARKANGRERRRYDQENEA